MTTPHPLWRTSALAALGALVVAFATASADSPPPVRQAPAPRLDAAGDPLPDGAIRRFGSLRYRVPGGGANSAVSADGKTLAVTNGRGIALLDLDSGKHLRTIPAEIQVTTFNGPTLAFSPDGSQLAGLIPGSVVCVWETASGKVVRTLGKPIKSPYGQDIADEDERKNYFFAEGLRFVSDGKEIALHAVYRKDSPHLTNGQVRFIDAQTGNVLREVRTGGALIGLSADQKTLLTGDLNADGRIDRFDAASGKALEPLKYDGKLRVATVAADGKTLVVGNRDLTMFVWDIATGERLHQFDLGVTKGETLYVGAMEVTPDRKTLLVGTGGGLIQRRDLATGKPLDPLRGHTQAVSDLFYRPDGTEVVSVSQDGVIQRWDWKTGKRKGDDDGYGDWCYLALSPDGRTAAIADRQGRVDLWDVATGRRLERLQEVGTRIDSLELASDGKTLAAGRANNTIILWDLAERKEPRVFELPSGLKDGVTIPRMRFVPGSNRLLHSTAHDGTRLLDSATGREIWAAASTYAAVAFSPDGKSLVATLPSSPTLLFLDPETSRGAPARKKGAAGPPPDPGSQIVFITFSPDGATIATAHQDGSVRLREPEKGTERLRLDGHQGSAGEPAFSADGKWLATTGADGTLCVWEVLTGRELFRRQDPTAGIHAARFSPEGRTLLTVGRAGGLLWEVRPGDLPAVPVDDALWTDLLSDNAAKAFRVQWLLVGDPKTAIALFERYTGKAAGGTPSADDIARWIAQLDADDFDARQEATTQLAEAGQAIEPLLRAALTKPRSPEQQRRLELLVGRLKREPSSQERLASRATQVLEMVGTPEAKDLLRNWAGGRLGALFERQARASLERMR